MNAKTLRVLLVDDHAVVRAGFRRLLEQRGRIQIVAEAGDGEEAYARFLALAPDVVVLDLSMSGTSGLEFIRRALARDAGARVLVFSMHEDPALAERALLLGARGYVTKSSAPEVLAEAVAEVAAGRIYLSADIARALALLKLAGDDHPMHRLSAREFEIFRLLVKGRTSGEIARILKLSAKTVANYHSLIKHKLGVDSDVELVHVALKHRLLL